MFIPRFFKKNLDYEKPAENLAVLTAVIRQVCPTAEIRNLKSVKIVVPNLSKSDRKDIMAAINRHYKNANIVEKERRLIIDIGIPLLKKISAQKKLRKPVLADIRKMRKKSTSSAEGPALIDLYGGISSKTSLPPVRLRSVEPRIAENIGLRELRQDVQKKRAASKLERQILENVHRLIDQAEKKYQKLQDDRAVQGIHRLFEKYEDLAERIRQNEKVEGVHDLFQQAQGQVAALKWAKELDEKKRANEAIKILARVVGQLKQSGIPRLRPVASQNKAAMDWAAELDQDARIRAIRQAMKKPMEELVRGRAKLRKIGLDPIQARLRGAIEQIIDQQKKRILADRDAVAWGQQIDREKASVRDKCDSWRTGDRHTNPFNRTNRGRKLTPNGATAKEIDLFCSDPVSFCADTKKSSRLASKTCRHSGSP